jgi:hypothetical protein
MVMQPCMLPAGGATGKVEHRLEIGCTAAGTYASDAIFRAYAFFI